MQAAIDPGDEVLPRPPDILLARLHPRGPARSGRGDDRGAHGSARRVPAGPGGNGAGKHRRERAPVSGSAVLGRAVPGDAVLTGAPVLRHRDP
jgi:hypothetical protein